MIRELAIALFDSHGGFEEGDIVACRKPKKGIGKKEATGFLWARADVSEDLAMVLGSKLYDRDGKDIKKRRYNIPLDKIKNINESFSRESARDLKAEYQPFLSIDTEMLFKDKNPVVLNLKVLGIIFDKGKGVYI